MFHTSTSYFDSNFAEVALVAMMKYILYFTLFTALVSLSHQSALLQSLKRCRRDTTCVLTPEVTEGPYYWNTTLMRQNISEDRNGIPLRIQILVNDVNTCTPIADAAVTMWHCDAGGIYSHYIQASQNVQNPQKDNSTFLRGILLTDANGLVTFDTIYPGWYIGRSIHIHVKVHLGGTYLNETSYYSGAKYVHTGQLFFNDSFSDLVNEQTPYTNHTGSRMLNSQDDIYASTNGYTLLNVQYMNSDDGFSSGLFTSITLGVTSLDSESTTLSSVPTTTTAAEPEKTDTTSETASETTLVTTTTTATNTARTTTTTKRGRRPNGHPPSNQQPGHEPNRPNLDSQHGSQNQPQRGPKHGPSRH
ncbi:unnamed protein product [Adineta ricciae]|uniref:Intradiol ring-cleavage dioxygenases domain-containing protein n=1 Tax=Adineta ricciae TaxID=249248 RepID=A0A814L7Z2_ADIRI|nr:unnamed protein product [Adineta ricciae]CAF1277811.1 unnamed protein product [Adineta ricciae]